MPASDSPMPGPLMMSEDEASFCYYTLTQRCPELVRSVVRDNGVTGEVAEYLEELAVGLGEGGHNAIPEPSSGYGEVQRGYCKEAIAPYWGKAWRDSPWLHGEIYLYHVLADRMGWWKEDPQDFYLPAKEKSVRICIDAIDTVCAAAAEHHVQDDSAAAQATLLGNLVVAALWGNKVDLCLFSSEDISRLDKSHDEHILANDVDAVVQHILGKPGGEVHLIADNYGYEIFNDLVMLDYLCGLGHPCTIHLKDMPYFVSDASIADVHRLLEQLAGREAVHPPTAKWARRVQGHLEAGRLQLRTHPMWSGVLEFREFPPELADALRPAHIAFVKGDLNYRKLVSDRHWDRATPFAEAVAYFPAPVCALRTLKSEVCVGVSKEAQAQAHAVQPWNKWGTSGDFGVIQFRP